MENCRLFLVIERGLVTMINVAKRNASLSPDLERRSLSYLTRKISQAFRRTFYCVQIFLCGALGNAPYGYCFTLERANKENPISLSARILYCADVCMWWIPSTLRVSHLKIADIDAPNLPKPLKYSCKV